MIEASCHCGRVRIGVPEAPQTVNECTCSICRRYGTLWAPVDTSYDRMGANARLMPPEVLAAAQRLVDNGRSR